MSLKRWFRDSMKLETDNRESSVKHAGIQRELERLNVELAAVRAELAARLAKEISHAAESSCGVVHPLTDSSLRRPAPILGRAGGLARAGSAWRYSDGTFMPNKEKEATIEQSAVDEYNRHAAGGRARAATAMRRTDGTFAPNNGGNQNDD